MRIVLAGGTGLLGRPLADQLAAAGTRVTLLSRRPASRPAGSAVDRVPWTPDGTIGPWAGALAGADAVINLAGAGIADHRWTPAYKALIRESRRLATRSLVRAIEAVAAPPSALISASAVGYYGPRGDEPIAEDAPPGTDFLAQVCADWERDALQASPRCRVVLLRTGLVLTPEGGALAPLRRLTWLGAGGRLGHGRQFMPWIHLADWVGLVRWLTDRPDASGPYNLCAPEPVTNAAFVATLASVMHRPALLPAPAFALRLVLGEMADALLLGGQRTVPARALEGGYAFRFTTLADALRDLLR